MPADYAALLGLLIVRSSLPDMPFFSSRTRGADGVPLLSIFFFGEKTTLLR
jgi:hypothetical protein